MSSDPWCRRSLVLPYMSVMQALVTLVSATRLGTAARTLPPPVAGVDMFIESFKMAFRIGHAEHHPSADTVPTASSNKEANAEEMKHKHYNFTIKTWRKVNDHLTIIKDSFIAADDADDFVESVFAETIRNKWDKDATKGASRSGSSIFVSKFDERSQRGYLLKSETESDMNSGMLPVVGKYAQAIQSPSQCMQSTMMKVLLVFQTENMHKNVNGKVWTLLVNVNPFPPREGNTVLEYDIKHSRELSRCSDRNADVKFLGDFLFDFGKAVHNAVGEKQRILPDDESKHGDRRRSKRKNKKHSNGRSDHGHGHFGRDAKRANGEERPLERTGEGEHGMAKSRSDRSTRSRGSRGSSPSKGSRGSSAKRTELSKYAQDTLNAMDNAEGEDGRPDNKRRSKASRPHRPHRPQRSTGDFNQDHRATAMLEVALSQDRDRSHTSSKDPRTDLTSMNKNICLMTSIANDLAVLDSTYPAVKLVDQSLLLFAIRPAHDTPTQKEFDVANAHNNILQLKRGNETWFLVVGLIDLFAEKDSGKKWQSRLDTIIGSTDKYLFDMKKFNLYPFGLFCTAQYLFYYQSYGKTEGEVAPWEESVGEHWNCFKRGGLFTYVYDTKNKTNTMLIHESLQSPDRICSVLATCDTLLRRPIVHSNMQKCCDEASGMEKCEL